MDINHQMKKLDEDLTKRSEPAKANWNKGGVYVWKSANTAVLQKRTGSQVQFYLAFEDLTQQGFVLRAQDEGREGSASGFSGGINSFYFFQKPISSGSEKPNTIDPSTKKVSVQHASTSRTTVLPKTESTSNSIKTEKALPKGF